MVDVDGLPHGEEIDGGDSSFAVAVAGLLGAAEGQLRFRANCRCVRAPIKRHASRTFRLRVEYALLVEESGGARRNRTADEGFADPCLATWLPRQTLCDLPSLRLAQNKKPTGQLSGSGSLPRLRLNRDFYSFSLPAPEDIHVPHIQPQHIRVLFCALLIINAG